MLFDPKLGYGICAIRLIDYACDEFTYMLYKPCIHGLTTQQQLRYQHVIDFTYWTIIVSFNNCNIITLSHKATTSEDFEGIHQVFFYSISDNVALLVQSGEYDAMNKIDTPIMGYYVIKFVSES